MVIYSQQPTLHLPGGLPKGKLIFRAQCFRCHLSFREGKTWLYSGKPAFFFLCSQLLPTHSPLYVVFFSAVFSDTGICGMPKFSKSFERTILSPSASRTVFGENLGPATSQGVGNFFGEPEWLDSTRPKAGIWGKHHHHFKTKPGIWWEFIVLDREAVAGKCDLKKIIENSNQ